MCGSEVLKDNRSSPIHIFTDSQASLKALSGYRFHSALVLECRDILQQIALLRPLTLSWTPGHRGIEGNEMADELARIGSSKPLLGPEPRLKLSYAAQKSLIVNWKKNISTDTNTKYFLSLSRTNLKRITGMLTGHCTLNKHLHVMGLANSPLCDRCGEEETAIHVLCECPAYTTARRKFLGSYILPEENIWSLAPKNIMKFMNSTNKI